MSNTQKISNDEFEKQIKVLLKKMDEQQLSKFLTILSARNIIYFSDDFFNNETSLKYLNVLFISVGYNFVLLNTRALARALARALIFEFALDRALARALDLVRARALVLVLVLALVLARALDRALDLDFAFKGEFERTTLSDAQNILQNDFAKSFIFPEYYNKKFKRFLDNLRNINANYWAEWFEEIFKNNFQITDILAEELLSLTKANFELTITETSALLLERRKGTI